jgi:Flp pilus assembly protein CpaB
MTIKVDATAAVEGWAGSGSIVDVLLIERDRTSVVAEKVRILSAERSVIPVEGQAMPNVPSTVTILVSQEQCLAINTAIPRGRIAFALRGTRDDASWTDTTFTAQRLGNSVSDEAARGESNINGFVSFTEGGETRAYALSKGKWINTEVIPQGALVGARASLGSITRDHGAQNQAAE